MDDIIRLIEEEINSARSKAPNPTDDVDRFIERLDKEIENENNPIKKQELEFKRKVLAQRRKILLARPKIKWEKGRFLEEFSNGYDRAKSDVIRIEGVTSEKAVNRFYEIYKLSLTKGFASSPLNNPEEFGRSLGYFMGIVESRPQIFVERPDDFLEAYAELSKNKNARRIFEFVRLKMATVLKGIRFLNDTRASYLLKAL